ncbi:MAG TPA: aldolase/citrate lyase family protein [Kofleriaceae bacterium]
MSPQLVELYGVVGLDFVIIGSEVESLDISRMEDMIRAADAARTVPIVKLRRPDPNLIAEAMNAGAPMVMVPHVTNRAQLETLVRGAQFEPEGLRGECPIARYNGYGALNLAETHDEANRSHAVIPIIEDREALDHLDDMMGVEEVDIFEVGPYDLSRSLGETGQGFTGVKTMAAIEKICEAASRHGKAVLAPLWHPRGVGAYKELLQHQMDELLARGINCVYELESAFLALHLARMSLLKRVREVKDEPTERQPVAESKPVAKSQAKPAAVQAKPAAAQAKPAAVQARPATNGKAKPLTNGKTKSETDVQAKPAIHGKAKPAANGKPQPLASKAQVAADAKTRATNHAKPRPAAR